MKLIRPTIITDASLVSSDIPEGAGTAWNSATTYNLDARADVTTGTVIDVYKSIRDGNRLLYSEQFDNAAWHGAGVTISANATTAPDGTTTADKIAEIASTGLHIIGQDITASNTQVVFSVYLKAADRSVAYVEISNTVSWSVFVIVDLSTGQILSMNEPNADFSDLSSGITAVGNGWYRCWLKATKAAVNTIVGCYVHPADAAGNYTYTGVAGKGIYAWGGQVEYGSSVGPYVPTTSAVVRNVNHAPESSPNWWLKVATTYAAYNSGTTYAQDNIVSSPTTHRRYRSVQNANTNHPLTDAAWWLDIGPTNRWAMFDEGVGSVSTETGEITVVMTPGSIDSLVLLDTDAELATVTMNVGGSDVYSSVQSTNVGGAAITDWFLYFFEPIGKKTVLSFLDLPVYPSATVTVQLEGANPAGAVSIGSLIVGRQLEIGSTEVGPSVGITDYSKKETDEFGVTTVVERAWSKRMELRCLLDTASVDAIQRELAKVRAIPCIWIGEDGYDSLTIYGFFKDFSLDLAYPNISYCSLTIEGLT